MHSFPIRFEWPGVGASRRYKKENGNKSQIVDERVLGYQLEGPEPNPGWRFFDLTHAEVVESGPPPGD
jgi:hypothetical protein